MNSPFDRLLSHLDDLIDETDVSDGISLLGQDLLEMLDLLTHILDLRYGKGTALDMHTVVSMQKVLSIACLQ